MGLEAPLGVLTAGPLSVRCIVDPNPIPMLNASDDSVSPSGVAPGDDAATEPVGPDVPTEATHTRGASRRALVGAVLAAALAALVAAAVSLHKAGYRIGTLPRD